MIKEIANNHQQGNFLLALKMQWHINKEKWWQDVERS
jgi:hypothetical protein